MPDASMFPKSPAPLPEPRRSGGLGRLWRRIFAPFWMLPALCCLAALACGVLLPQVDEQLENYIPFVFQAGPDGARTLLSTIAGAMISVTGLVFSITIVVLQLASSQFSPRVLRTFLDDRTPQLTLGVFSASFVYALTVMRDVSGSSDGKAEPVPQIALTLAFVLVLLSVAMFLAFIHHITQSISVDTIIRTVGNETLDLLERGRSQSQAVSQAGASQHDVTQQDLAQQDESGPNAAGRTRPVVIEADASGYVNYVDHRALVELAATQDGILTLLHPLGTYLVPSQPLAQFEAPVGSVTPGVADQVRAAVTIAWRRSMEQDITFGMRQLVDIGERALSPGVNDPTTAIQVLNQLHTILHRIIVTGEVPTVLRDDQGAPRLVSREWTFDQYVDLCVDEIAHWGATSLQVPARLNQMLTQLEQIASPDQRTSLQVKRFALDDLARSVKDSR